MKKSLLGRSLTVALAVGLSVTCLTNAANSAAAAAPWPYKAFFSAVVNGDTLTATTTITARAATTATEVGVCATGADGTKYRFPKRASARLGSTPVTVTTSRKLPVGIYAYFTCFVVNGEWTGAGGIKSIFVPGVRVVTVSTKMPVGNLSGWKQTFSEDFNQSVARGRFSVAAGKKWSTYNGFKDTFKTGVYDSSILSVHDGTLDESLARTDGTTRVAALAPVIGTAWRGQLYGRFSVRFRADPLPGFKTAFLLWPDSNIWSQGEVDFPDASLTSTMWGFNHCPGNPSLNCAYTDSGVPYGGYHTLTIEWKPRYLGFIMDGRTIKTVTQDVPNRPMHWVLQTESTGNPVTTAGHLLVDWATVYRYAP